MKHQQSVALLFFSRRPRAESRAKHWWNDPESARAIASSLILQSSQAVQASGFPVFHFHEATNKGARLANALPGF
ncbi:MAG: hypothetical protein R2795_06920 [Saprospiraceae bacterium]